jgi:hypothetical protein
VNSPGPEADIDVDLASSLNPAKLSDSRRHLDVLILSIDLMSAESLNAVKLQ